MRNRYEKPVSESLTLQMEKTILSEKARGTEPIVDKKVNLTGYGYEYENE